MIKATFKSNRFTFLLVAGLLLTTALSKTEVSAQNSNSGTKFSSVYTDTTKDCKGAEPTFTCKGYGDYKFVMGIGGVFADARVESTKSDYNLSVAERQSVAWNPKIEWRMADGKPFAIIVRVDVNDENAEVPKKTGEKLIVKGLMGYESLNDSIDAKTPQANERAREIADKAFSNGGATKMSEAETSGKIVSASLPIFSGAAYDDGKASMLSDAQIANLKKLNAAVAVPTYVPAGYKIKNVEIQEPEAHIVAFSIVYQDASGKSFTIESNNEALGDMAVKREVKGSTDLFLPLSRDVKTTEFYAGHDENDPNTVASEWLCSIETYQPKKSKISQCFQLLSDSKSISPAEAVKIMQSLRYLKR